MKLQFLQATPVAQPVNRINNSRFEFTLDSRVRVRSEVVPFCPVRAYMRG